MKRIAVVLAVVMVAVILFASCGVSQEEVDEQVSTAYNTGYSEGEGVGYEEGYQAGYEAYADPDNPGPAIVDLNTLVAKKEQEIANLWAENECLRQPASGNIAGEVVGTVTLPEFVQLIEEFFPNATDWGVSSFTKDTHRLVSFETLEDFLAKDITNSCPGCFEGPYNLCDELAFRLKDRWIRAGLPPLSIGFIKLKVTTPDGEALRWLNIFITMEEGELIVYKVDPSNDTVTKITEPDLDVVYVFIGDRM